MTIATISKINTNPTTYKVLFEDNSKIFIATSTLINQKISKGAIINNLATLRKIGLQDILYEKSLYYLSVRVKCRKDIYFYLSKIIKTKYGDMKLSIFDKKQVIDHVTKKLVSNRYLNDEKYAIAFIKDKMLASKPYSINYLKIQLIRKGIDKNIVDSVTNKYDSIDYKNLYKIATSKLALLQKSPKDYTNLQVKQKIFQFLTSKGYNFTDINKTYADLIDK